MNRTITIAEAKERLSDISDELSKSKNPVAVKVTHEKKPVLAIMPWEFYEGLIETLEIMKDGKLMGGVRESIKELKDGKTIPWDKMKRELGL